MAVGKKLSMGVPPSAHLTAIANNNGKGGCVTLGLPPTLTLEEKKFLLAVERGDIPNVRRILQKAHRKQHININCMDPLGRRALTLAIDNENLEMVELLIIMGVETKDALLHAINAEFIEAVELLLEHEELIHKEGEPYSWQKVDINMAVFPPDITPLMLAAHKNNFEILKTLLDRGAAVPVPHDIRCGCDECVRMSSEDSLRHSLSRVNMYRALASPSLICLTSTDPILTAFQLSWELRNLAFTEQECKSEYLELRRQCQKFAVDLLDQTRTSNELAIILNYDPEIASYEPGDRMGLTRLVQAISYKQKKFVSHANVQQLLSALWYDGLPGFRRMTMTEKFLCIVRVAVLFPLYCVMYMLAPNFSHGQLMRKPFMKFLIHASSYLFFLFILILVSQRADDEVIKIIGTARMKQELAEEQIRQRGRPPTKLEFLVVLYVFGFIWEEVQEIFTVGMNSYLKNLWNFIDFLRNGLYVSVICLRTFAYIQQATEISHDPKMAYIPREQWHDYDPQLIAEGLFAAANVFSALKLVHLFSINPHLGPLQISLGRMVIDIVKFFSIYSLVLFAFACGLNQLLWYFADLEKNKCYILPNGEADWAGNGDACMKWRRFGNLFESSQSLFWASFGMIGLENFELTGIKSYTRFWGLLMFGSYSVINVIVLLNLLIAMMSNSYAMIDEHSDTEWKFARTKLWMSFFEDSPTLPPPFNIMPSVKWLIRVFRKSSKEIDRKRSKKRHETQTENTYENIMRALVWRYVSAQQRKFEVNPVTEDDINEVKCEISTMRYEMLEIFENSGMDCSSANKKEKPVRAKRNKDWERRLMRGFNVAPIQIMTESNSNHNMSGHGDMNEIKIDRKETPKERFRRVARTIASQSATGRWTMVYQGVAQNSQIGRCCNKESVKNLRQLGRAIEEAKKLILVAPQTLSGRESPIGIDFEDEKTSTLLQLLDQISDELGENLKTPSKDARPLPLKKHVFSNKPPCDIQVKSVIKEHGFIAADTLNKQKINMPLRASTQPDMHVNKGATFKTAPITTITQPLRSNEPILSAAKLATQQQPRGIPQTKPSHYPTTASTVNKPHTIINTYPIHSDSVKKTAPAIPTQPKTTHKPFAVEMGQAGRYHGYSNYENRSSNKNPIDLTFVDINDDSSEIGSIATIDSPKRDRSRSMTQSFSIESDNERPQSANKTTTGGVKSKETGAISKTSTGPTIAKNGKWM